MLARFFSNFLFNDHLLKFYAKQGHYCLSGSCSDCMFVNKLFRQHFIKLEKKDGGI